MQEFQGTVEFEGCAYHVSGVLEVRERNGSRIWSGYFEQPKGADFSHDASSNGPYPLRLEDNRSGSIVLCGVDVDGRGTVLVDFQGQGELQ